MSRYQGIPSREAVGLEWMNWKEKRYKQGDEWEERRSEDREERFVRDCSVLGCKWDENLFCSWHNETA